jgi:hypothetical protein
VYTIDPGRRPSKYLPTCQQSRAHASICCLIRIIWTASVRQWVHQIKDSGPGRAHQGGALAQRHYVPQSVARPQCSLVPRKSFGSDGRKHPQARSRMAGFSRLCQSDFRPLEAPLRVHCTLDASVLEWSHFPQQTCLSSIIFAARDTKRSRAASVACTTVSCTMQDPCHA